jgi:mRNA-degrading endonuclease toxin of MazEF toxin-antitoxin module
MKNKFDIWNEVKQKIDSRKMNRFLHVKPKEIWYVNIWQNVWFESCGKTQNFKRPVLVVKIVWVFCFVLPMTTQGKNTKFYHKIRSFDFWYNSFTILSQARIIDKKRFIEKIWKISVDENTEIKEKLKWLLL